MSPREMTPEQKHEHALALAREVQDDSEMWNRMLEAINSCVLLQFTDGGALCMERGTPMEIAG